MVGFSSYNQIKMHLEDMEKTTFVTMWETFCYKVMPFRLKNTGVTYQRAMVEKIPAKAESSKMYLWGHVGKVASICSQRERDRDRPR
ncbi:RNA-directed DNA polymerase-like protein [Gossypium australe]|uniref:RNA-directed DNA polymerase-like protein n=1 Tax=Gossypium australe TaxID=47621 RepID=A0A5B6UXN7_9ROSI|nr:RNA-directed DNA polymerase-like protein [Gossypium australe]